LQPLTFSDIISRFAAIYGGKISLEFEDKNAYNMVVCPPNVIKLKHNDSL